MTHAQKERIASLRGEGASYAQIAAALGVSENTVKSYGRRNRLDTAAEKGRNSAATTGSCDHCGKPLVVSGQKTRRFCSDECRMEWWKEHPEVVNRKAIYHFSCSHCGASFHSYGNNHRKYCSHDCYAKAKTIVALPLEVCS